MRNTYDNINPFSKGNQRQQSRQRDAYTTVTSKQLSYQKTQPTTTSNVSNTDKFTKTILQTLKRITKQNDKYAPITILKPNPKTLTSTISLLLQSFDDDFDQDSITIQGLPDLLRNLGYPYKVDKSYFTPVGAPHTWNHCLSMMAWLAELANFHWDIRGHLQQGQFGQDFTQLLIRAHFKEDPSIVTNHLQQEIQNKKKSIQDCKYSINTDTLAIQNLKAAQKDLYELEEQQKSLQALLYREQQQVIKVDQQQNQMLNKIKQLDNKILQQNKLCQIAQGDIATLQYDINHQELSKEQIDKINFQIQQNQEKIRQLKQSHSKNMSNFENSIPNLINQYISLHPTLQGFKRCIKQCKSQVQKRGIHFSFPQSKLNQLTEFLNQFGKQFSQKRIQQLLGIKEILDIREKANTLVLILENEAKIIERVRQQFGQKNLKLSIEIKDIQIKINDAQKVVNTNLQKLNEKVKQSNQLAQKNKFLLQKISSLQQEIQTKQNYLQNMNQQIKQLTIQTRNAIQFKKIYEAQFQQMKLELEDAKEQYKLQMLETTQEYYQQFQQFTQEFAISNGVEQLFNPQGGFIPQHVEIQNQNQKQQVQNQQDLDLQDPYEGDQSMRKIYQKLGGKRSKTMNNIEIENCQQDSKSDMPKNKSQPPLSAQKDYNHMDYSSFFLNNSMYKQSIKKSKEVQQQNATNKKE